VAAGRVTSAPMVPGLMVPARARHPLCVRRRLVVVAAVAAVAVAAVAVAAVAAVVADLAAAAAAVVVVAAVPGSPLRRRLPLPAC
jgi:hypothetical protein